MSATQDPRELRESEARAQDAWAEAMDDAWRTTEAQGGARGRLGAVGDRLRGIGGGISGRLRRRSGRGDQDTAASDGSMDQATRQELEARARALGIKGAKRMSEAELAREIARRF